MPSASEVELSTTAVNISFSPADSSSAAPVSSFFSDTSARIRYATSVDIFVAFPIIVLSIPNWIGMVTVDVFSVSL